MCFGSVKSVFRACWPQNPRSLRRIYRRVTAAKRSGNSVFDEGGLNAVPSVRCVIAAPCSGRKGYVERDADSRVRRICARAPTGTQDRLVGDLMHVLVVEDDGDTAR